MIIHFTNQLLTDGQRSYAQTMNHIPKPDLLMVIYCGSTLLMIVPFPWCSCRKLQWKHWENERITELFLIIREVNQIKKIWCFFICIQCNLCYLGSIYHGKRLCCFFFACHLSQFNPYNQVTLCNCWLGDMKGIQPVKKVGFGFSVVTDWLELCT